MAVLIRKAAEHMTGLMKTQPSHPILGDFGTHPSQKRTLKASIRQRRTRSNRLIATVNPTTAMARCLDI